MVVGKQGTRVAAALLFGAILVVGAASEACAQDATSAQMLQSAPTAQVPQPAGAGVNWSGAGVGVATAAANVLYVPAKVVYGIIGAFAGGFGYVLTGGNTEVADTIWRSALGGDYVLTPSMITGDTPIHFSGPTQTARIAPEGSAPNSPAVAGTSGGATGTTASAVAPAGSSAYATSTYSSSGSAYGNSTPSGARPIDAGAGPVGSGTTSAPATAGSSSEWNDIE